MSRPLLVAAVAMSLGAVFAVASPVRADAAMDADEARCAALSSTLSGLIASMDVPDRDSVTVLEAEGIGAVAEELLEEGDTELARVLFEEAIALLEEVGG